MRRLFQHIAPLKLLVVLLLVTPFNAYPQQIVLERVSIEPTDSLRIIFRIDGEHSGIEELYIRFYPDLTDVGNNFDYPLSVNNELNQIIYFEQAVNHTGQLHFRLFVDFQEGEGSSNSKIHSAVFLESIESISEACDFAINARWSNYAIYPSFDDVIQDPPIFDKIQVLMSGFHTLEGRCMLENESILAQFDQALGDSEEMIDLSSANINPGDERYCFRVRSFHSVTDIESYSNIIEDIEIEQLAEPSQPQIISVDVNNNEAIEISVEVDSYGYSLFVYSLERSNDIDGSFELINRISHGASEIIFYDGDIPDYENNPWYYKVIANKRDCPMPSPPSSLIVSSIYLKPIVDFETGQDNLINIEFKWKHVDPDGGYEYALIEELQQDQERVIYSSTNQQDAHTETIDLTQLAADVKFFVRATHPSLGYPIHSNYFLFSPEWLKPPPNAFRPGSTIEANQEFIPEFYFPAGITGYSLSIYDRNGLKVFQTPPNEDPGEGWDGIIQTTGQPAPEGAYIYEISFDQADKPTRGVIYLVR